jgi:N1-aminopropylagmatine ureohydrolase
VSDLPVALSFLGVQDPFEDSSVVILPVPYDLTTTYQPSARFGPRATMTASLNLELFDEELRWDPSEVGIHTASPIEPLADGPSSMLPVIGEEVSALFHAGKFPILLGGDGSVVIGALDALKANWDGLWIVQIGGRANLREEYQGSPYSHACAMSRARELFPCVQAGIKSWSGEEEETLWEHPDRVVTADDLAQNAETALDRMLAVLDDPIYISIDLSCLDPAIMPAASIPEPGGLTWRQLTHMLKSLSEERHVVGFDVHGLAPIPGLIAPDLLSARLIYKLISYVFYSRQHLSAEEE